MKVLMFIFGVFLIPSVVLATPVTGPIKPETILHFHPELNAVGTNYRVPVVVGGVTGVAEIGADLTVGRLLANVAKGATGPWGAAAVTAAMLCYQETDWKICHSTIEPIVPIQIDTSKITPASFTSAVTIHGISELNSYSIDTNTVCTQVGRFLWFNGTTPYCTVGFSGGYSPIQVIPYSCIDYGGSPVGNAIGDLCKIKNYFCSSGILTNSFGAPMAVTGQYCTPETAYSCPENYSRSDSYGNLGDGMFCAYQAPTLTSEQQANMMKPVLLQYYADQLFNNSDGSVNPDYFSDAGTTFDPVATPSTMPMTWDQLKQYVDWVRRGTAQTTDPLAPHYITPSNYDYTNNYITNNDSAVTNSTSNSTSTTITPADATSSAAITQSQYEASNKKADDKLKTDIAAVPQPSFADVLKPMDDYKTDVQNTNENSVVAINSPSALGYGSSTCWRPSLKSFNGTTVSPGDAYCSDYDSFSNPLAVWALWIGTALYLWHFGREQLTERV